MKNFHLVLNEAEINLLVGVLDKGPQAFPGIDNQRRIIQLFDKVVMSVRGSLTQEAPTPPAAPVTPSAPPESTEN